MFKKIPKPLSFPDKQDKKRPISAPRAQNKDIKFINGSIKLSQGSKPKQDKKPTQVYKPCINFNSKGKKGFNAHLKIEGTLFNPNKYSAMGMVNKANMPSHSPFEVKSRNSNINANNINTNISKKKSQYQAQHYPGSYSVTGSYKGNIQLVYNQKGFNKKEALLSPQINQGKGDKTPESNGLMATSKSTHSANVFLKIGHNINFHAKKKLIANPYQIKVTKAFRSITPVIKPKYSNASIKPKIRNTTPTEMRSALFQPNKSLYGLRNQHLSFNEEMNKSMRMLNHHKPRNATPNNMSLSQKKLNDFKSKKAFIMHPIKENGINNNQSTQLIPNNNIAQEKEDVGEIVNEAHDKKSNDNKPCDNEVIIPLSISNSKNSQVKSLPTLSITKPLPTIIQKKIKRMHEFSKTGYAGEDEKKVNQDNYFVFHNFVNSSENIFMAVCDGHGAVGQEVSGFIKENLPNDLNKVIQLSKRNLAQDNIHDLITDTFTKINDKLSTNEMINSMLSGSTCVSVIYTPQKLITANVGDSRAIIGKYIKGSNTGNEAWKSLDITRDHKPSEEDEKQRIIAKGGRVEPMKDEDDGSFIGPPRVWVQEEEYPGLAMSRSFGDRVAHSLGVIAEPEIKEYIFEEEDRFLIVASDGLFEFISSQEIVDIVKEHYRSDDIVGCCDQLYSLSSEKWMKEEEVRDDITMIIVFFDED